MKYLKGRHDCDILGCQGIAKYKLVSWIHPLTGIPVLRNYCGTDAPVHCPVCKFTIGIVFKGIDKRRKKRTYKCLQCDGRVFELDLF